MADKTEVWLGTLSLMVLRTLATIGPQHGYGLARRIEQISGDQLSLNYGTLYPALLKLEQEGAITAEWGVSDNNRKAKFYRLTRAGRRHSNVKRTTGNRRLRSWPASYRLPRRANAEASEIMDAIARHHRLRPLRPGFWR
jgi:PadR family transcriptional regulator PadR